MARTTKMVMKQDDVTIRLKLLANWDYLCVVCGHGFRDISSVTFEHLVPKALSGKKSPNKRRRPNSHNSAPSHYNCNHLRGHSSLIEAARQVKRKKIVMGEKDFFEWINKAVPNRIISPELMAAPVQHQLRSFELPEWLPGMSQ